MIPTLYDKTGNNKIGDLNDCIECLVEEERNGIFELTMVYPANSSILESIVYDNIIVADANDYLKSQKFRVYNTRKLMANRIEICARHISFDLVHDWVDVISIENQSCEYALNTIFRNSQFSKHFKGHSDIVNAQNFKVNKVTCLEAIGGTSGSILDTYGTGAEILRDNTDIHVLNRRGRDNDVVIEYRKNLTGLEVEEDTTDLVTRIMPYAIYTNSNDEEIEVRGDFIDSPLINNYAHPYVKYMDYSEKFEDDEVPTKTKLNNLAAKEYINNKVDIPKNNYKIEFIPLSKCAGYEGLEDRINLCDVVTIKDSRYNIDTQAKVIKVVFDVLRGRYDSMELGEPRTTLGDIIGGTGGGPTQGPPGPPGPQGPAGADGSIGDFPETLPEVPNITAKVYGFANIEISWTFENKVYYSYELYASKTKGFAPNTFNLIFSGQASTFSYQVNPNETWYFKACALNTHGQRTEFSEEVEVSTVKISDLSNYVESAAIGDALIGELNLGRGWYGELRGNYIDAKQMSVTDGNGKRTLDIDSFGNVNLDVTSLKIRANSVATESFVTTAKNDAITSANGTLTTTIKNYYTKTETDSQIKVAKDSINLGVSQTYETKTNVTSKVNGAISTASNDATTKANNALSSAKYYADTKKTEAINSANNTLNTTIANYYTKSQTDSQINVAKDSITQSVSNTYETKTEVNNKINAIQIGGTNLLKKKSGFTYGYLSSSNGSITNTGSLNTNQDFYTNDYIFVKQGTPITFTSYPKQGVTSNIQGAVYVHFYNTNKVWQWCKSNVTSANQSSSVTYTTVDDCYIRFSARGFNDYNHKAEYGTKATDWSPAPEDTDTTINNLTQRVSTAESKITDTAITNVVRQNFYTKSETDNQITSKGYQTASQVQQTVNALQLKFTQSGGYNRVRNGIFKNGTSQWSAWGSPSISTKNDTGHSYGKSLVLVTTGNNQGVQQTVSDLTSGKTYTLSAYVYTWAANDCGIQVYCGTSYYSAKVPSAGSWQRISVTFKATSTSATVQIGRGGWGADGQHLFTAIQFEEGELATTYTPHPSEIYDGITTIDKDGIKVTSSDISGYTQMSSSGFVINKNNTDIFKVDSNGLAIRGSGSNSGRYIKIENEDYTVWNGNVNCMRFGYKNWNGWDGVPEFLMGYKGMRYSTSTNTGEDASYFGMQTFGRGVKDNNTYAYHDLYYRSDKYANQHHIRFTEDGLMQLKSLKRLELMGGSNVYVQVDTSGGLTFPQGVKTFGVSDTIWLQGSNFGMVWGKYSGKEEYNFRPTNNNLTDLGHGSYRWRTIYATNGTVNTSDINLKENIVPIVSKENDEIMTLDMKASDELTSEDFYQFVKDLPLYSYDYKSVTPDRSLHNIGFIAQDIADTQVGQEFVFKGEDGVYQYNMQGYVGVLAVALQKAIKEIENLKEEVRQLKATF